MNAPIRVYEAHPAANLFPMMDEARLQELAADIAANGQLEPIRLFKGKILDGRNRYQACAVAGIAPKFSTVPDDVNPWKLVWSLNGERRDITTDQRFIAWKGCDEGSADFEAELDRIQREANEARKQAAKQQHKVSNPRAGEGKPKDFGPTTKGGPTKKEKRPSADTKAAAANVGRKTVEDCEWLERHRPDLFAKVAAGGFSSSKAKSIAKKEERQAEIEKQKADIEAGTAALPEGVFEVIAMDPPWNYGREYDPDGSRVANPYPEMTQAELLAMDPPFADDCVLFLWTTHQFIWDAKALLDHWGFTYKATLVWDKERIGMGATVRMQCEFCLLAFKGKPTWSNTTWRDIIREARREHSRKPDVFYRMVEECTVGRRLEMFSREQRPGWGAFGNDTAKF